MVRAWTQHNIHHEYLNGRITKLCEWVPNKKGLYVDALWWLWAVVCRPSEMIIRYQLFLDGVKQMIGNENRFKSKQELFSCAVLHVCVVISTME